LSDIDEVEEIASKLEMNPRESARYDEHLEEIRKNSKKVKFWKFWNFLWQVIFFWGLVVIAIEAGQRYSEQFVPSVSPVFNYMNYVTFPMSLVVGVLGPFSFFLMIWTGIVRSKWEGKLTRATAYTLSFLSNIEHRGFMDLDKQIAGLKKETEKTREDKKELPEATPRKSARESKKKVKKTERDEMLEKSEILKKAYQDKRITIEEYEKYMKRLREMYRHMK
jgi:hypothetical protein